MTGNILLEEITKQIDNKNMLGIIKQYLSKSQHSCDTMAYVLDRDELRKYKDVLIEAHKIFVLSQELLDELACKDIELYENRDMDIVMCYTLYSGILTSIKNHLPEEIYKKVIDIYEEASLYMNIPRDDEEENKNFFTSLRKYYCDFFIPLKLIDTKFIFNEYDFSASFYKQKFKNEKVPNFVLKKKTGNEVTDVLTKKVLEMCIN